MKLSGAVLFKKRRKTGVLLSYLYPIPVLDNDMQGVGSGVTTMYQIGEYADTMQAVVTEVTAMSLPTTIIYSSYTLDSDNLMQGTISDVTAMSLPTTINYLSYTMYDDNLMQGTISDVTAMSLPTTIAYMSHDQYREEMQGTTSSVITMTLT